MNVNPSLNDRERRYEQAIAKQYAPLIFQDMDRAPLYDLQQDFITKVNYDGDWESGNNWDNFDDYRDSLYAYVYYYLVETETHYFIIYSIFHPRDWLNSNHCNSIPGRDAYMTVAEMEATGWGWVVHENDLEQVQILVEKGQGPGQGEVQAVATFGHNDVIAFFNEDSSISEHPSNDPREPRGGAIAFDDRGRPLLYIQTGGHGIYSVAYTKRGKKGLPGNWPRGAKGFPADRQGIVYTPSPRNTAGKPENRLGQQRIPYKLLHTFYRTDPQEESLWERWRADDGQKTYDGEFPWQPMASRMPYFQQKYPQVFQDDSSAIKRIPHKLDSTGFLMVGADNADSPFRFEFDYFEKQKRLGDNVFDPAWAWQQCFKVDGTYSLDYLRHPYLEHAQPEKE